MAVPQACRKCHTILPVQIGPGPRRTMCERCSPRKRPRRVPAVTAIPSADLATQPPGRLTAATRDKLVAVGREDTPEGTAAVLAAEQLDAGKMTGAQYAALLKAYLSALDTATKGIAGGSSALDELRKRRDARRRGA